MTGGVEAPEAVRDKLVILRRHGEDVGRPFGNILRTHFTIWLMPAEDEDGVRRKVERFSPDGLDDTWRRTVVAGTPERVAAYYQIYADVQYFIAQVSDAGDHETIRLLAERVVPKIVSAAEIRATATSAGASGGGS